MLLYLRAQKKASRSVLVFTDSQCKPFKVGVDLPELGRSKETTDTHTIAAASAEFCMKWGNLRGL